VTFECRWTDQCVICCVMYIYHALHRYLERNVVLHFNNVMKTHTKDWQLVVDPKQETLDIVLLAEDDSDDDNDRAPAAEPPTYVHYV
jgi:hypothetical protein